MHVPTEKTLLHYLPWLPNWKPWVSAKTLKESCKKKHGWITEAHDSPSLGFCGVAALALAGASL